MGKGQEKPSAALRALLAPVCKPTGSSARTRSGMLLWLAFLLTATGTAGAAGAMNAAGHVPSGQTEKPVPGKKSTGVPEQTSAGQPDALAPALQRWAEESASSTWTMPMPADSPDGSGHGMRVEVTVGQLNPRLRLAACDRIEPFLPSGTRLWGRSFIGARCTAGASWSTMIPVEVSVYGPALVARLPLRAGTLPDHTDFRIEEVDWTASARLPVSDPAMLEGRSLGRALAAGQVLHASDLRIPQTIAAGDPVRIRMIGKGFSISANGFALAAAGDGQSLRIRTETGKMLVGIVRNHTVEIRL